MAESEQIAYNDNKSQTWFQYRSQIFVSSTRSARFESEKKSRSLLFLTSEKALRVPKTKIWDLSERTQFVRAVNYLLLLQKWQVNISIPGAWTRAGSVRCDFRSLRNQQWIGKLWTPTLTNGNNIWIFFFDIFAQRKPQYMHIWVSFCREGKMAV